MPISQGSAGGLPGMNLKAWVLLTPAGVVVKSFNVSTVTKPSAGNYSVTFAAAMAGVNYVARFTPAAGGVAQVNGSVGSRTATVAGCLTGFITGGNNLASDAGGLWEFYE